MPRMPNTPFNEYLGGRMVRMEGGEAEYALELGPHHTNNRGVAHGGVVSALLDSAMGAAVISAIPKEWWCATTGLTIQFVSGAHAGHLTATGKVVRRGRSIAFVQGEARDATGKIVAIAQGTWHLWPHKPGMEETADEGFLMLSGTGQRLRVGKILAVGRNYTDHNKEMGHERPVPPVLFFKPPSAIVQDGGVVTLPTGLGQVHHEVELVVAIGARGRAIPEDRALEHVLGYAVGIDLTLRDLQSQAKSKGEPWALAKGFDGSAPISMVVPKESAGDISAMPLTLDIDGARRQEVSTSRMLHGVAALVAYASQLITLERGDLLFTGTPSGVGPVAAGEVLEARLGDIATLRVTIA
jgi:uncharacterized protein (TIGR00369 family)